MDLQTKLQYLTGIGPILGKRLEKLGLKTVEDLINHYPFRYEDLSQLSDIADVKVGETLTLKGEIWSIANTYTRFRKVLTKAILSDGTNTLEIIWFNQPWLTKNIKVGDKLQVAGKIKRSGHKITLLSPHWEKITSQDLPSSQSSLHTGRLIPIYPETYGLTSKWLRQKIAKVLPAVLQQVTDALPETVRSTMLPLTEALAEIHFPTSYEKLELARQRLAFDELFYVQLATQKKRADWQNKTPLKPFQINQEALEQFINNLPFRLTQAQKRVTEEIITDLQKGYPMNRLVQGDVGSGKTVVAAAIIYLVFLNNLKSILMAPTEILAFQHYATLAKLLNPYGIKIGLYTGSRKFTQSGKRKSNTDFVDDPDVIIGTHALLSEKLVFEQTGLVVIDEQQRFGVEQRSFLRHKSKLPHFLTMTATPIPRTVALTLYGDLDLSVIDQMPKGRKKIKTYFVPQKKRKDSYQFIRQHLKTGEQAYIITPLIEQSETMMSAKAAKIVYDDLRTTEFANFKVGLLHGRLKSKEKEKVINDFSSHQLDVLVSTSVVEVGVDVQNATIMVIEGAERFGLAQLHQLRGRVGRGDIQSYLFLFTEEESYPIVTRLKNLETIHDGLKLAELDLQIRGSGEIFGLRQSGEWDLQFASLTNLLLIEKSRQAVLKILLESPTLDKYPMLERKLSDSLQAVMPD